jgi:hypothetical protein
MADFGDEAQAVNERFLELALSRRVREEGPVATGRCLYCEEPVEKGRRWCDADCRDGWEKDQG